MITIKRIYQPAEGEDGYRILVDRLWPRGVSKEKAALDEWLKDVAPSTELRTWYGHKPERFKEFSAKYETELESNPAVEKMKDLINSHDKITLLYGARDPRTNHAAVLAGYLDRK